VWGFIFLDPEGDGLRTSSDPRLADVKVELRDASTGRTRYTTTSGSPHGYYIFQNAYSRGIVAHGTYELHILLPSAYEITTAYPLTLNINECRDYGYTNVGVRPRPTPTPTTTPTPTPTPTPATGSISGFVWEDLNRDGTMQPTESGIPGVTVELTSISARPRGTGSTSTVTDNNGYYRFANVPPGTYLLSLRHLSGYFPTTQTQVEVSLGANTTVNANFGLYPLPYRYRAYLSLVLRR